MALVCLGIDGFVGFPSGTAVPWELGKVTALSGEEEMGVEGIAVKPGRESCFILVG
jgi:hypothetical protein